MVTKKLYPYILVGLLLFAWLTFAFIGIMNNYSFWTDESNVALYARQIVENGKPDLPGTGYNTGWYQIGYQYLIALFFIIFGISEFSARLISVLAGFGVLIMTFCLVRRVTNSGWWGLLSIFIQGWWSINLAYSSQARPYMLLQLILITLLWLMIKKVVWYWRLILMIGLIGIACLMHSTGVFFGIVLLIYLIELFGKKFKLIEQWRWLLFGLVNIIFGLGLIYILRVLGLTGEFNNWLYLKYILRHHLWFLLIPLMFGIWMLMKQYQTVGISVVSYCGWVLVVWLLFSYSYNIRYLIPMIGLLVVISGIGLAEIMNKSKILLMVRIGLVVITLIAIGSQIVWWPKNYYSPNVWLYGDVQNADYKSAYRWMIDKYGRELNGLAIFDSWNDRTLWYLRRSPEAMFVVSDLIPEGQKYDVTSGAYFYTTLDQFKAQQAVYPQGLVLVEEWQSTMPEEIKQYIRQNLKLEYTVNGLTSDEIDRWPLAIYSWGII